MNNRLFRKSQVVTIKDALGLEWDINEARPTKYGFDLYYGKRKDAGQYDAGGPNRLIYTEDLKAFWENCALKHDGTIYDVPAGRTTLKRARMALGFNWDTDSQKFWRKHKHDLITLTPREFEQKHKDRAITGDRMKSWRLKIVGGRARPLGWWKKPEVLTLLLSEVKSLNQVRAELERENFNFARVPPQAPGETCVPDRKRKAASESTCARVVAIDRLAVYPAPSGCECLLIRTARSCLVLSREQNG